MIPTVKVYDAPNAVGADGGGILMTSDDLDDLKKAVIYVTYGETNEYDKLVKSGELEHELKACGFYDNFTGPIPHYAMPIDGLK